MKDIDNPSFLARYGQERNKVSDPEIPSVNLYRLGNDEDREGFIRALTDFPKRAGLFNWASFEPSEILLEAVQKGILVDRYPFQLRDYAETLRVSFKGNEKALLRFIRLNDNLRGGTVVEYLWKSYDGRFVRVLDEDAFHKVVYSRNKFVIPDQVQESLRKTTFAVAGLSVGGNSAYLLMLSGVEHWIIADGGLLDLHDFNRVTGARVQDIGVNQAVRWARSALEQNPYLKIRCLPYNLSDKTNAGLGTVSYDDFLTGADRVIEAVDQLGVKAGLRLRSDVVMPTDMGLGAKVEEDQKGIPFHGRLSQEELNLLLDPNVNFETKTRLAVKIVGLENIPPAYLEALKRAKKEKVPYWPQPGLAAFLAAAMLVAREIARLKGSEVKPEMSIDLEEMITSP
jgi:hypothetical protein